MKFTCRTVVLLIALIGQEFMVQSQHSDSTWSASLGISTRFEDGKRGKLGGYIGVNKIKPVSPTFAWEGQVALLLINARFEEIIAPSVQVGPRWYLNTEDSPTRMYMNLLAGIQFQRVSGDDYYSSLIRPGYSSSIVVEPGDFKVGLGIEAPQEAVLKLGYNF